MAKYTITHKCGHEEVHNISGPVKDRDRKAEYLASRVCRECWLAEQNKKAEADASANQAAGLPELSGSAKQISWAESIRAKVIGRLEGMISTGRQHLIDTGADEARLAAADEAGRKGLDWLKGHTESRWWIDHRDSDMRTIMGEMKW